jgi:hypothetical protein
MGYRNEEIPMVTDKQVRRLIKLMKREKTKEIAAMKAGMDVKTSRKYMRLNAFPSELKKERTWRTRRDIFSEVWDEVSGKLALNPVLEAKTLFEYLQRRYPGKYQDGQLRTFQRRVKYWKAMEGHGKEVFFPQTHHPGELAQSDFTHMDNLDVTIQGEPFKHLIYHFVLTYSNWETGTICYSESMESLSVGLQNALWGLGGVPKQHQTDRLTVAVQKTTNPEEFTDQYSALLRHYGLQGRKTQAASPNENGDIEQRHYRFKRALDQSLMLRGSRDFDSRKSYAVYLEKLFVQLNQGRKERLKEELTVLKELPSQRIDTCKRFQVKVSKSSTIRIKHNVYSVHSRLIGEQIDVRLYAEYIELWYGQKLIETLSRIRGENRHRINYRHVIDWLVRKPGAFENYRYRQDMFPTHHFRLAYDAFIATNPKRGHKDYLKLLNLAARENELLVETALHHLMENETEITLDAVKSLIECGKELSSIEDINIADVELKDYDSLLMEVSQI